MSGAASSEAQATRARPLSGGLWSLLAWLRREDSGASSDSLSSVGSDRTVASFAFLAPHCCRLEPAPLVRPPGPPTDSYRRRLRDRNTRLQHDRDLTLHRKYGLYRGENDGYDAFSLPPPRKSSENRERRAASEGLQRRAAHVPGKRRAPPPPARAATLDAPRRSRKRPAPQPPRRPLGELCRNAPIPEEPLPTQATRVDPALRRVETMACKPEKYIKKDAKEPKPRAERNFLRQIFESRKRNSAVDPIPERILPSISELDKQAAEIIESCKLKALDRSSEKNAGTSRELMTPVRGDMWFCTRCLRKYNDSVVTCGHCVTEQKMKLNKKAGDGDLSFPSSASNHYTQTEGGNVASTSGVNEYEDKQKLKEMLKEIKDSLPKKPKHDVNETKPTNNNTSIVQTTSVVEAPTLRIGSKIIQEEKPTIKSDSKAANIEAESKHNAVKNFTNTTSISATETAIVTQPVVLQHLPDRDIIKLEHFKLKELTPSKSNINSRNGSSENKLVTTSRANALGTIVTENISTCDRGPTTSNNINLNIPLKISSLLNANALLPRKEPEKELKAENQVQQNHSYNKAISSTPAQPLVSISDLLTTNLDSSLQGKNPGSSNATPQVVLMANLTPQEQTTQKILKTSSTTQTSSNVVLDLSAKCKQNTSTNDKASDMPKSKLELYSDRKYTPPKLIRDSTQIPLFGTQGSNNSTAPERHINNKKNYVEKNGKLQNKSAITNVSCNMTGVVPNLDTSRVNDHQGRPGGNKVPLDLHSRRRDLINQLEQSIAKGDEQAAADAAAKLAQLRLSCSVLSFSSQIVGTASTSIPNPVMKTNESVCKKEQNENIVTRTDKHITRTKSPETLQNTSSDDVTASSTNTVIDKKSIPIKPQPGEDKNKKSADCQTLIEPSTSKQNEAQGNENVSIEVWIEDREAARGPIRMNMPRVAVMGDLRRQANASFGLAAHLQRWIVGRTLCTDDNTPLNSLAGPTFDAPFYLCLVEPDAKKQIASHPENATTSKNNTEDKNQNVNQTNSENKATDVYAELVLLERRALVPNAEDFECGVCLEQYKPEQGAVLRECVHTFCKECLSDVVKHSEEPAVSCPAMGCPGFLQEREIRALVSPEDYERWLARGLAAAESGTRNAFHCRTRDCQGWALCEPGVTRFPCPVCKRTNCVSCQAIHEGETCERYRAKQRESEADRSAPEGTDEGTKAFLDTLISRGEALECPECSAIITKKWGCDWIKCSACKTEICWVTRGRRWGPGGRGDTSAGCRCGVDGKRCHPSCGYCH